MWCVGAARGWGRHGQEGVRGECILRLLQVVVVGRVWHWWLCALQVKVQVVHARRAVGLLDRQRGAVAQQGAALHWVVGRHLQEAGKPEIQYMHTRT